jgi:hypothetical protein
MTYGERFTQQGLDLFSGLVQFRLTLSGISEIHVPSATTQKKENPRYDPAATEIPQKLLGIRI